MALGDGRPEPAGDPGVNKDLEEGAEGREGGELELRCDLRRMLIERVREEEEELVGIRLGAPLEAALVEDVIEEVVRLVLNFVLRRTLRVHVNLDEEPEQRWLSAFLRPGGAFEDAIAAPAIVVHAWDVEETLKNRIDVA
jgi:hypothetical protein